MSFAESFWTEDYHLGHEALFGELYEGIKENQDFIALFTKRMDLELRYGTDLETLPVSMKLSSKRHANDDYVSTVKNAFSEISNNFYRQGENHTEIADKIWELVLQPFTKWCKEHEQRIGFLEQVVSDKYKQYSSARTSLEKMQKRYFNKCRLVEDFKTHFAEEELDESLADVSVDETPSLDATVAAENDIENAQKYAFGGSVYGLAATKKLLTEIISNIELTSHKVPILGTYHNVSTGSSITQWLLDNMPELRGGIAKAEEFGQDLLVHGFVRLIGSPISANKTFINSSQYFYQWKPVVFELTGVSEFELSKLAQNANYDPIAALGSRTNQFSNYLQDMKQAMGVAAVDYTDKTQYSKLVREVSTLDAQYYETTKILDSVRCEFEEIVMDHMAFMQKCELDRLRAVKKATFDFIAAFSNKISALKLSCDKLLLVEETMHPAGDLRFLIENYSTGKFRPHVTLYDNYYTSNVKQTFGVDLNAKARLDKKAVPLLVQAVLSYLDSLYPDLDNDEERVNLWTAPVHLAKIHLLREALNEQNELSAITYILKAHDPATVTNVLKLYFMELPDSIVSHTFFDLIKTFYTSYPVASESDPNADKSRVRGLQNTLIELPVCNLATLDSLLTHLTRLVHIISSKNETLSLALRNRLCREFGALVLRPKHGTAEMEGKSIHSFNMATEVLQQDFIADLFLHKETIFGELKRRNSKKHLRTNSAQSDTVKSGSVKLKIIESSKLRLESKLKNAVQNAAERLSDKLSENGLEMGMETDPETPLQTLRPSVPPFPEVPSKTLTLSVGNAVLKNSTSSNKKKLTAHLDKQSSSPRTSQSLEKDPVSDSWNLALEAGHSLSSTLKDEKKRGKENVVVVE